MQQHRAHLMWSHVIPDTHKINPQTIKHNRTQKQLIKTHQLLKIKRFSNRAPGWQTQSNTWSTNCCTDTSLQLQVFFFVEKDDGNFGIVASLAEGGTLKLGAHLISFLLFLLEVSFKFVGGEAHFGVTGFVWGAMGTEPRILETLGCSGSPPAKFFIMSEWVLTCEWVHSGKRLTRICCSGCSSWSSGLPQTDPGSSIQTGSSLSWCFCRDPSCAPHETGCQHSA